MPHRTPEARAAYQRAYRERNREELAAKKKARRERQDPEITAAYMREYYQKNKDRARQRMKAWLEANRDRHRETNAAWRRKNPDGHRVAEARRRAKVEAGSFTLSEWHAMLEEFDHRCAYCQGQGALEIEHMTPLSRGGGHARDNIVPACGPCNRLKKTQTIFEFLG